MRVWYWKGKRMQTNSRNYSTRRLALFAIAGAFALAVGVATTLILSYPSPGEQEQPRAVVQPAAKPPPDPNLQPPPTLYEAVFLPMYAVKYTQAGYVAL